jgi:alkylation response protein AidB-like acyl-CoA dehydrogenase
MNFEYSEDQDLVMSAVNALLSRYREAPHEKHGYIARSPELRRELREGGFLEIVAQPGFGLLDGALIVEAVASCPVSAEVAATTLLGPLLGTGSESVAVSSNPHVPVRYLEPWQIVCVIRDSEVLVGRTTPEMIEPVSGVLAYPVANLTQAPADPVIYTGEKAAAIRRRANIALAVEAAGIMRGALEHTVRYVKEREQFGQPLGQFQGIQHRLAESAQMVRATRSLALRAAFNDDELQTNTACLYAQIVMRKVITDCHQFCGAMGLTLEFPLHLWTYRLKYLQGEAGGKIDHGRRVAQQLWTVPSAQPGTVAAGAQGENAQHVLIS